MTFEEWWANAGFGGYSIKRLTKDAWQAATAAAIEQACDAVEWELGERTLCERLEKNLRTRSK